MPRPFWLVVVAASADAPTPAQFTFTRIADTTTAIPGGTDNFTFFEGRPSVSGTTVVFGGSGSGGQNGVYVGTAGGPLTRVADTTTSIPGGTGTFTTVGSPAISGTTLAFSGSRSDGQSGIYAGTAGSLGVVANTGTSIPGGTTVAFLGFVGSDTGVYFKTGGGALTKLIAEGDTLDGREVANVSIGPFGLDGTALVFQATFSGGASGVYYVDLTPVPEPGLVLGLVAVGLGGVRLVRRRSRAEATVVA
jgi:hypothetical protein